MTSYPVFPEYRYLRDRLQSFEDWPSQIRIATKLLAYSGYCYRGIRKTITCYYCGQNIYARVNPGSPPCTESMHFDDRPGCHLAPEYERGVSCANTSQDINALGERVVLRYE